MGGWVVKKRRWREIRVAQHCELGAAVLDVEDDGGGCGVLGFEFDLDGGRR